MRVPADYPKCPQLNRYPSVLFVIFWVEKVGIHTRKFTALQVNHGHPRVYIEIAMSIDTDHWVLKSGDFGHCVKLYNEEFTLKKTFQSSHFLLPMSWFSTISYRLIYFLLPMSSVSTIPYVQSYDCSRERSSFSSQYNGFKASISECCQHQRRQKLQGGIRCHVLDLIQKYNSRIRAISFRHLHHYKSARNSSSFFSMHICRIACYDMISVKAMHRSSMSTSAKGIIDQLRMIPWTFTRNF